MAVGVVGAPGAVGDRQRIEMMGDEAGFEARAHDFDEVGLPPLGKRVSQHDPV
jgi:hypothetical protein